MAAMVGDKTLAELAQQFMDGRGSWRDHIFVERLWKTVKYERVYLHAHDTVTEGGNQPPSILTGTTDPDPHSRLGKRAPCQRS